MELAHLDEHGNARMVDVGEKPSTARRAIAHAFVRMSPEAVQAVRAGTAPKGDVAAVARIAGIMAAKRVDELIPLCHSLPISAAFVDMDLEDDGIHIRAGASAVARTGVEMEALTAVSVAALTVYDMCKAIDKAMTIEEIRLVEKTGGKSGDYHWKQSE